MDILLNILPVFLVIFLGAGIKRLGFLKDSFVAEANHLVFYVGIPALLFSKLSKVPFHQTFDITLAATSCFSIIVVWGFSLALVKIGIFSPLGSSAGATFVQTSIHSNMGYIGLALVFYIFGNSGLRIAGFLAPFIILVQNILSVFTFTLLSEKRKSKLESLAAITKTVLFNPVILSASLGLGFSYYGLELPGFIGRSLEILSSMALPTALLIIGASLSLEPTSRNLLAVLFSSTIKLLFLPCVGIVLFHLVGAQPFSIEVAVILLGVPTATISVVYSSEMGGNVKFASSAVTLSTVLSLVTLWLWDYLIRLFI